jgi:hypothetical protein
MDYLKTIREKVIKGAETEDQRATKHVFKHSHPAKPHNAYSARLVESGILIESQATHKIRKPRRIAEAFLWFQSRVQGVTALSAVCGPCGG